jgi:mannose-6-phosphate isomerase-like protein (cupin superfamily)
MLYFGNTDLCSEVRRLDLKMEQATTRLLIVGPEEGRSVELARGLGVQFKIPGYRTGGHISIVEHPIEPRRLVPPHTHSMEDELSYVLSGRIGVRIGDEIAEAGAGTYVYKPCGVPHTFWNPTDEPARLLEIITPAGFEDYFAELADLFAGGGRPGSPEHEAIAARYHESHFGEWIPELKERYGLRVIGEP